MRSPTESFRRRASCSLTRAASPGRSLFQAFVSRLQQRPVVPIGGVIGQAQHFDRRARQLRVGAAAGQDRLDLGTLAQPRLDFGRLRVVGGADIDIRRQPAVEPDQERAAETLDHGGDADIDRQRKQQRHQGERQTR